MTKLKTYIVTCWLRHSQTDSAEYVVYRIEATSRAEAKDVVRNHVAERYPNVFKIMLFTLRARKER